jgi:predicted esterase
LLHGRGETREERAGLFAWLGPSGLARAWERLVSPPIVREREAYLTETELSAINQSLALVPFRGVVVVCPYMPNPYAGGDSAARIERYTETLMRDVLPAVYERIPAASKEPQKTGIAGVSLGGAVALEVYVRRPALFGCLGTVQGAYGKALAPALARRIAEAAGLPERSVYVATSDSDPYCAANERLSRELETRGVPVRFSRRKGPHSQGWLVEIGSLELLSWHDRALRGQGETGRVRGG